MRFRAVLAEGEKISKQPIPFVYVTKDWWHAQGRPFHANLELTPRTETVGEYLLMKGVANHRIVHVDVVGLPAREANAIHYLPFIYMSGTFYDEQCEGAESFDVEFGPES